MVFQGSRGQETGKAMATPSARFVEAILLSQERRAGVAEESDTSSDVLPFLLLFLASV